MISVEEVGRLTRILDQVHSDLRSRRDHRYDLRDYTDKCDRDLLDQAAEEYALAQDPKTRRALQLVKKGTATMFHGGVYIWTFRDLFSPRDAVSRIDLASSTIYFPHVSVRSAERGFSLDFGVHNVDFWYAMRTNEVIPPGMRNPHIMLGDEIRSRSHSS